MKDQMKHALLGLCLCIGIAAFADKGGRIAGTVTDRTTGEPLSLVRISVTSVDSTIAFAFTDGKGKYLLENIPKGTYSVTASTDGYKSKIKEGAQVSNGFTLALDFTLTPSTEPEPMTPTAKVDLLSVPLNDDRLRLAGTLLEESARKRGAAFVTIVAGCAAGGLMSAFDEGGAIGLGIAGASLVTGGILTFGSVNKQVEAGRVLQGLPPR